MRGFFLFLMLSTLGSCKPHTQDSDAKYAVPKEVVLKGSIFELLNKPDATLKVCLLNENLNAPVGKAYLDLLEADFQEGLYSWLEVASQHSTWIGPSRPKIEFIRFDVGNLIRVIHRIRQTNDLAYLAQLNSYIEGPHKNFVESMNRYLEIIKPLAEQFSKAAENLGCKNGITITGLTSKSDAQTVQRAHQIFGKYLIFTNDSFLKRLKNLWAQLLIEDQKDVNEQKKLRDIVKRRLATEELDIGVWDRAFVDAEGSEITIGLPNYMLNSKEAESHNGQVPRFERLLGKWAMIHEIGHLFLLKDVYVEDASGSALARHPNALMGNHVIAAGTIQEDDRKGLFAILDGLASGKITTCADGYTALDNSKDFRAEGKIYCIPSSPSQSQGELATNPRVLLNTQFYENDPPRKNYPIPSNSKEPYPDGGYPCLNGRSYTSYPVPVQPQYNTGMGPANSAPIGPNSGMMGYPQVPPPQGAPSSPCQLLSPYKQ